MISQEMLDPSTSAISGSTPACEHREQKSSGVNLPARKPSSQTMASATAREADSGNREWSYQRHRPEQTLLYQLVEEFYPRFVDQLSAQGRALPVYVQREFDDYLKCGRVEYGFVRVRCQDCHAERLVAFSCKRRGFCPSCGARCMVESAALLVDEVLPRLPMRRWVLSFPFQLRFLLASRPEVMSHVLGIVYRTIETYLIHQAGYTRARLLWPMS